mmetsp:Transcript_17418/g.46451  ORF Transcript_17418/g.46451 Transcript_17418/m.46451 type:complete len:157 (-) Transcript_17418:52-522(-)
MPEIPWAGKENDPAWLQRWSPELELRIPDRTEFENAGDDHFSNVVAFHRESKTMAVDDTWMFMEDPALPAWLVLKPGVLRFHPRMALGGVGKSSVAVERFRAWVEGVIRDWDVENIACAHDGVAMGNGRNRLRKSLEDVKPTLDRMAKKYNYGSGI